MEFLNLDRLQIATMRERLSKIIADSFSGWAEFPTLALRTKEVMIPNFEPEDFTTALEEYQPYSRLYITVYTQTMEYGGPEEGGWWYNWNTPHSVTPATWQTLPEVLAGMLQKESVRSVHCGPDARYSDVGCGYQMMIGVETIDSLLSRRSTYRPHYE